MNEFVLTGSEQACKILDRFGSSFYPRTCLGYENAHAFYWAGATFWAGVGIGIALVFFVLRKSIGYAFNEH